MFVCSDAKPSEMIGTSGGSNIVTAEEVASIGSGFATRYFDALMGEPGPSALPELFDERSVYVFAQRGRPDHEISGSCLIRRFLSRMWYGECTIAIRSVVTTAGPLQGGPLPGYAVSSACELSRPGDDAPLRFAQTFVIKRVPWTRTRYRIVETRCAFDEEVDDDFLPSAVSLPIVARVGSTPQKAAADVALEKSTPKRTDVSNVIVNTAEAAVSAKKVAEEHRAVTYPDGEPNGSGRKTTECPTRSSSANVSKSTNGKATRAYVSRKKVAENPMAEIRPMKNTPKVVSKNTSDSRTTQRNTGCPKNQKATDNVQSVKSKIPGRVEKKAFVSANRFASLAVNNESSDSSSVNSHVRDKPKTPRKSNKPSTDVNKTKRSKGKLEKCANNNFDHTVVIRG